MDEYPKNFDDSETPYVLRQIAQKREDDVSDWNNLPNRFVGGRKVLKVPTSSSDVATTDKPGDMNYVDSTGYYYLMTGTRWLRVQLVTF